MRVYFNVRGAALLLSMVLLVVLAVSSSALAAYTVLAKDPPSKKVWLEELDLTNMTQGWGKPVIKKSVTNKPLTLGGKVYEHGVGTHARSEIMIDLKGATGKFSAVVGVDDAATDGSSVVFQVWVDNQKIVDTNVMRRGDAPKQITVEVPGAKLMYLVVTDAGDGITSDHADWADAVLQLLPGVDAAPESVLPDPGPTMSIAPANASEPAIHGPRTVGATPGRPFLFMVPATGKGPLTFSAKNLPAGLSLDSKTGIISGSLKEAGRTVVELAVECEKGRAVRNLVIVGGEHQLALTPPMGWNSWYIWFRDVDDAKMRAAADAMISSGLASHGYSYVNIDDCWEGERDSNGEIQSNKKFPDMKALGDYIHSKGMKFGIYSSPGPKTCTGFEGSYKHEEQDAKTYAKWGVDFLKHDWCSATQIATGATELEKLRKPYLAMSEALAKCDRDIVFSLCQYGMGNVWEWGAGVGGNLWRTTGDLDDRWARISEVAFSQNGHEKYAAPGHWNDTDMLLIGKVGIGGTVHQTRLTPNEQITQMTMWSLLASPLLISSDLTQLDQFTIDVLCNDEVIDVDQDPLGKPAKRHAKIDEIEVWTRPLWDGTTAVGIFNRGFGEAELGFDWSDLGLSGPQQVRDLWQRKDLGSFEKSLDVKIPRHGVALLKVGTPSKTDWQ